MRQIATTDFVSLAMTARNVIEMTVYERVSLRGIEKSRSNPLTNSRGLRHGVYPWQSKWVAKSSTL
ncbi:MAG: hypothetical protein ACREOW_04515 [Thermodesulfobacteriota bacterium]